MNLMQKKLAQSTAISQRCEKIVDRWIVKVSLLSPIDGSVLKDDVVAIWDTGASCSAISEDIAQSLNLPVLGKVEISTANDVRQANSYFLTVQLASKETIPNLRVSDCKLKGIDMLLGMDVINRGDFHISNCNGKTVFTFKMPSTDEKDYVREIKLARACATRAKQSKKKK